MPWTGQSFKKHNKKLTDEQARSAAHVANRALREGKTDAEAIRLANYIVKRRRRG